MPSDKSTRSTEVIMAICPFCGEEWAASPTFKWIGNGKPRLFCPTHEQLAKKRDTERNPLTIGRTTFNGHQ